MKKVHSYGVNSHKCKVDVYFLCQYILILFSDIRTPGNSDCVDFIARVVFKNNVGLFSIKFGILRGSSNDFPHN